MSVSVAVGSTGVEARLSAWSVFVGPESAGQP